MNEQWVPQGWEFDWEGAEDLTALDEEELRDKLAALVEEEHALDYGRRVVQGRIDLIRAQLAGRGAVALSPEELARVLLGELPRDPA
ncbi:MAG: hypothetical protein ACRDTR_20800 [Rubrobacter sp.]